MNSGMVTDKTSTSVTSSTIAQTTTTTTTVTTTITSTDSNGNKELMEEIEQVIKEDMFNQQQQQQIEKLKPLFENCLKDISSKEQQKKYLAHVLALVCLKCNISYDYFFKQPEFLLNRLSMIIPIKENSKQIADQSLLSRSKTLILSIKAYITRLNSWMNTGVTEPGSSNSNASNKELKKYTAIKSDLETLKTHCLSFDPIMASLSYYKTKYDQISAEIFPSNQIQTQLLEEIKNRISSDQGRLLSSGSMNICSASLDLSPEEINLYVKQLHQRTALFKKTMEEIVSSSSELSGVIAQFRHDFVYLSYLGDYKCFNTTINYGCFITGNLKGYYNKKYLDTSSNTLLSSVNLTGSIVAKTENEGGKKEKTESS